MDDITFVKIGGDYRPVAYNFNVVKGVRKELNDPAYQEEMAKALKQKMEEVEAESVDELSEEDKEDLVATQGGTDFVLYQWYYSLKEGHRLATPEDEDFTVEDKKVEYDPEEDEMTETVAGEREVTPEDVGDWLSKIEKEAAEKFNEFVSDRDINDRQKKA